MSGILQHTKTVLGSAVLSAVLMTTACGLTPLHEERRILSLPHVPASAVRVQTANGFIKVHSEDREDVQVTSRIAALTEERLKATRIMAGRDGNQVLTVTVEWPGGKPKSREGCSIEIVLPEANGVSLRSSNGALEIRGLAGKADLETSNGKVLAERHSGPLAARSSNGSILAIQMHGPARLETSNGKILVQEADGSVTARTSNGSIDIELAAESPGPVTAKTSNGSVSLTLGEGFAGELEVETSVGSLTLDEIPGASVKKLGKNHARLLFETQGAASSAVTRNGSVTVKRRP